MAANRHRPPHGLLVICLKFFIMALACQVANARLLSPSTPDARLAETPDIKSGGSLSEPTPPANVSRGLVEPFTGFPKGVAYAAGYIFILHESGKMYRCNVSNQHETCYQQNSMYRGNAFNWIASCDHLDTSFARRMVVQDDEHIITASLNEIYRCSTMNPYSCTTIYQFSTDTTHYEYRHDQDKVQAVAVGGGRIFAAAFNGNILSFDEADGSMRMYQLEVISRELTIIYAQMVCLEHHHLTPCLDVGEGVRDTAPTVNCAVTCCCAGCRRELSSCH
jgi:hypothetical protein